MYHSFFVLFTSVKADHSILLEPVAAEARACAESHLYLISSILSTSLSHNCDSFADNTIGHTQVTKENIRLILSPFSQQTYLKAHALGALGQGILFTSKGHI